MQFAAHWDRRNYIRRLLFAIITPHVKQTKLYISIPVITYEIDNVAVFLPRMET
ncbi:hypothetical protein D3C73_986440 [compost metagenome]